MSPHPLARVQLLGAAALFSTGGAAIKACSLTGWQVACLRSAVAALALWVLLPSARRRPTAGTLLVGVAYAATLTLFVLANKRTTAANTIFLQSVAPLYILVLGPWLLGERTRRSDLVVMAVLATGMVMFFVGGERTFATAPDPLGGNLLASGSGLCWAFTMIGLRSLGRAEGSGDSAATAGGAVLVGNGIAAAATAPWALPLGEATGLDWALVTYLGVFQIALAYLLVTAAMRHVPALEASLLLLVEPVLNPVWAWLAHGERPGPVALAGGVVILIGTALMAVLGRVTARQRVGPVLPPPD